MYISPQQAQKRFGYHPKTLADWADEGKIEFIRSPGGHRLYLLYSLEGVSKESGITRKIIIYARVSTHSQKEDLVSQARALQEACEADELIKKIGSGMNLKRRKFLKLMQRVTAG